MSIVNGLMALDSYFKEGDAREVRDRQRKRFEYEDQRAQAEMQELPTRTEANINRNRLAGAQSAAGLDTLPMETSVRQGQLGAQQRTQAFNQTQEPLVQATTAATNQMGLATAQNSLAQQPGDIAAANTKRGLTVQQQAEQVLTEFARNLSTGDKAGALRFANTVAADPNIFPETNGMKFSDIKVVPSPDGRGQAYQLISEDGTPTTPIPVATLTGLIQRNAPKNEYQAVTTNDGGVLSFDKRTGVAKEVKAGNPKSLQDKRPAEARLIDYYISRGMSEGDAIQRAGRLKDMSPSNAAFQLYKDRIAIKPNASPEEKRRIQMEVEAEVQNLFGTKATPGAAPASNPGGTPTMNVPPNISRLIGG